MALLFAVQHALLLLLCGAAQAYTEPGDRDWPSPSLWSSFAGQLSGSPADLTKVIGSMYRQCRAAGTDAKNIRKAAAGICMQQHQCANEKCAWEGNAWGSPNDVPSGLPAYTVAVRNTADVQAAVRFARQHNIKVSVKNTGHNSLGSSTTAGSLLIWMYHFKPSTHSATGQRWPTGVAPWKDSCGVTHPDVLRVGAASTWEDAYLAAAAHNPPMDMVGGGGLRVGAAGGWLQGGGLSAMARAQGLGVDNVRSFEVVLADGSHITADACENEDMFWALRGGGGGTFGVVTAVRYQTLPSVRTIAFGLEIYLDKIEARWGTAKKEEAVRDFVDFWVRKAPTIDRRWGGYWHLKGFLSLHFRDFSGTKPFSVIDAKATLIDDVERWLAGKEWGTRTYVFRGNSGEYDGYFEARGRNKYFDASGAVRIEVHSRLIPTDWLTSRTNDAVNKLLRIALLPGVQSTGSYLLGGAVSDVGEQDTAMNPAVRRATFAINLGSLNPYVPSDVADLNRAIQWLRDIPGSGGCYNHMGKEENWVQAAWGANAARLQQIKQDRDPAGIFHCWPCIRGSGSTTPIFSPSPTPSPTALPSPSSPAPTPGCDDFCAGNTRDWASKCGWSGCSSCGKCLIPPPQPSPPPPAIASPSAGTSRTPSGSCATLAYEDNSFCADQPPSFAGQKPLSQCQSQCRDDKDCAFVSSWGSGWCRLSASCDTRFKSTTGSVRVYSCGLAGPAPSVLASPPPPPPIPDTADTCKPHCAGKTHAWAGTGGKCTWNGCSGCTQCSDEPPPSTTCKPHCAGKTQAWAGAGGKCTWNGCKGCAECPP